jgi:hypothetical protein
MTRDSAVGIATGYGLDGRGLGVGVHVFQTGSGPTQPPIKCVPGDLLPGVKRSGREGDHSRPTSAEVKNTWIYTSIGRAV